MEKFEQFGMQTPTSINITLPMEAKGIMNVRKDSCEYNPGLDAISDNLLVALDQ
jgi:hypothetical protein